MKKDKRHSLKEHVTAPTDIEEAIRTVMLEYPTLNSAKSILNACQEKYNTFCSPSTMSRYLNDICWRAKGLTDETAADYKGNKYEDIREYFKSSELETELKKLKSLLKCESADTEQKTSDSGGISSLNGSLHCMVLKTRLYRGEEVGTRLRTKFSSLVYTTFHDRDVVLVFFETKENYIKFKDSLKNVLFEKKEEE